MATISGATPCDLTPSGPPKALCPFMKGHPVTLYSAFEPQLPAQRWPLSHPVVPNSPLRPHLNAPHSSAGQGAVALLCKRQYGLNQRFCNCPCDHPKLAAFFLQITPKTGSCEWGLGQDRSSEEGEGRQCGIHCHKSHTEESETNHTLMST